MLLIVKKETARAHSLPGDLRSRPLVAPKDPSPVDANDFSTSESTTAVLDNSSLNERPDAEKESCRAI